MFLAWIFQAAIAGTGIFTVLMLPSQVISWVTVWAANLWLERHVMRRRLGLVEDTSEQAGTEKILAQQDERHAEATAPGLTMAAAWLTLGFIGMFGLAVIIGLVAVIPTVIGVKVGDSFMFFAMAVCMPGLLAGWVYLIQKKTSTLFPSRRLVLPFVRETDGCSRHAHFVAAIHRA